MAKPSAPSAPAVRLVRAHALSSVDWLPDDDAARAIAHTSGSLRLTGAPGTGKTSVLARSAAARLNEGTPADAVLLLTFSRRAAAELRDQVVAETTVALREVPVRSFESYAWAVLDRARRRHADWSAPRLITGSEQDAIIRELLAGSLAGEGATTWPAELRAALGTRGFAAELRDAVMRCVQRGITAQQLAVWAMQYDRPQWGSLASFMTEYAGVTGMRLADSYDPAELVRAVVDLWRDDLDELAIEHNRIQHLYIDEAEELDAAKIELVHLLARGVGSTVLSGDPDQSVFGFRGADRRGLMDFVADDEVVLQRGYRATPEMAKVLGCAASFTGATPAEATTLAPDSLDPLIALRASSAAREAADVASVLRERHLVDGVPWSEMAVVVRSVSTALPVVRRAFAAAGVPIDPGIDEPAVGRSAAVRSLVDIVRMTGAEHSDAAQIEEILRSPYFRLDALQVRRMRKALRDADQGGRTSSVLLAEVVAGRFEVPRGAATSGLRAFVRILDKVRAVADQGGTGEELLYAAWQESGAEQKWRAEALRGGSRGADADQRLDSVIAAFDIASSLSSRLREASFETIAAEIDSQELPADRLSRGRRSGDTVTVLSANNAKGRQWEIVAIMGVQDGVWPNLVPRNTILRTEDLADIHAGINADNLDRRSGLLQEERRLFYLALARARRQVVLSAVEGSGERPSRFFTALCDSAGVSPGQHRDTNRVDRHYSMLDHVSLMRTVVLNSEADESERTVAVGALQMLAAEQVEGAAPQQWYALRDSSTTAPIHTGDSPVSISPSAATTFMQCPLKWFLGRVGATQAGVSANVGTLVHKAFESVGDADGRNQAELFMQMKQIIDDHWHELAFESPWEDRRWNSTVTEMVTRLSKWLEERTPERAPDRRWVANEQRFDVVLGEARVRGVVDRLERDPGTGRLYTIDLKTGTSKGTPDGATHPQLAIYQLAAQAGAFEGGRGSLGAELLFAKESTRDSAVKSASQQALADAEDPHWAEELLARLADGMSADVFTAQPGDHCRNCDFIALCPAIRQIGEDE